MHNPRKLWPATWQSPAGPIEYAVDWETSEIVPVRGIGDEQLKLLVQKCAQHGLTCTIGRRFDPEPPPGECDERKAAELGRSAGPGPERDED